MLGMSVLLKFKTCRTTSNSMQIQARLGEVLYMAASASDSSPEKYLPESLRRFCRSIELCDDYLRGYYGLKLVCILTSQYVN